MVLALANGIILGGVLAGAEERARIDLFDPKGRRTGYAIMDRETGRIDFYDSNSRHTGYGRVDGTGKVERFGVDGRRQGETAVPVLPGRDRPR
jgi:sugar lactone lactonase YvrE